MIDDFAPPGGPGEQRKKPKRIEPLPKPEQTPLHELAAQEEPDFKTPEEIAETDSNYKSREAAPIVQNHQHKRRWPFGKKQTIYGSVIVVLLIILGGTYVLTRPSKAAPPPPVKKVVTPPPAKPKTVASNLTGLQVDPSVNLRPVTGVMIENSLPARPQSGLAQAGVVFEAIAEGGITRFLALYQDTAPDYLGPVRSARPYFVQWCMGFDCSLAHVGGSPEALQDITNWHVKNLGQFANGSFYHRISSRYAPHNMYTSMANLNTIEQNDGFGTSHYTSFVRKADSPSKTPNASSIEIDPSGYYYNDHYTYNATTNNYTRSEGGQPHTELTSDGKTVQITPKIVIAMVMNYSLESDHYHSQYNVVGSGTAYIFQDGTVTVGTWSKSSMTSQITFTDSSGQPIGLDAGQTWITAVGSSGDVSYK